jgi:hypothetical protein
LQEIIRDYGLEYTQAIEISKHFSLPPNILPISIYFPVSEYNPGHETLIVTSQMGIGINYLSLIP